jgi:hypothetical protein
MRDRETGRDDQHPRFSVVLGRDQERKNLWIASGGTAGLQRGVGRNRRKEKRCMVRLQRFD